mmetsp:Transcript_24416/g.62069  ORF Transcript_24416/g.62069 Transcript_24416/m.62069 type:complete len:209 (-) Transcript_24416:945-1571(-)
MRYTASGRPSARDRSAMAANSPAFSLASHCAMMRAILGGDVSNAPTRFSTTYGMLPSSWQGMLPLSRMGRPEMSASAMVPGPALVMMASLAAIHSWMLFTNPVATTLRPPGLCRVRSFSSSARLRPHTTTTCAAAPSRASSCATVSSSAPMPSPPPISSTVGRRGSRPSRRRMARRPSCFLENTGRMGRPCCTTCAGTSPLRAARPAQ